MTFLRNYEASEKIGTLKLDGKNGQQPKNSWNLLKFESQRLDAKMKNSMLLNKRTFDYKL